eukprot:TRINITY_DN15442_c0_g1_i1.p2 TRINITY_DN15442_c0_g1~~TRINITY_DN15442_c0_g1_i1.p2  ORF type:complete len:129 (-),score=28.34 TRINITY_DN15442_c0_g1_i1:433-819(-)
MSRMSQEDAQAFMEQAQKTFMSLRQKQSECSRNLAQARSAIQMHDRERKRSELTKAEVESLPAGTKTYRAVGKMFLLAPPQEVLAMLKTEIETHKSDTAAIAKKAEFYEKTLQDTVKNITELKAALPQ